VWKRESIRGVKEMMRERTREINRRGHTIAYIYTHLSPACCHIDHGGGLAGKFWQLNKLFPPFPSVERGTQTTDARHTSEQEYRETE